MILQGLFPSKRYSLITFILIFLNIGIFIVMIISGIDILNPSGQSLLSWGANLKSLTLNGQWWRLITACFVHAGIVHLAMNMFGLIYLGLLLEPVLGRYQYIISFLLCGISGSLVSLWWHDSTISIGASGAIFGLYGIFLILLIMKDRSFHKDSQKKLLFNTSICIVYNLIYGLQGDIDNAAHIGGLICGISFGLIFHYINKSNYIQMKLIKTTLVSFVFIVIFFLFFISIPNPFAKFNAVMERVINNENIALGLYRMPQYASREEIIIQVKTRGINYWDQNLVLLNELHNLPENIEQRVVILKEYFSLRKKVYELILENLELDSSKNIPKIDSLNKEIEIVMEKLRNKKS